MFFKSKLCFILLLFYCVFVKGQSTQQAFIVQDKEIGIEHGMKDHVINNAYADSLGFVWLVSDKGMYRYDGEKSTFYNNEFFGLSAKDHLRVVQDKQGQLWGIGNPVVALLDVIKLFKFNPITTQVTDYSHLIEDIKTDSLDQIRFFTNEEIFFFIKNERELFIFQEGHFKNVFEIQKEQTIEDVLWLEAEQCFYYIASGQLFKFFPSTQTHELIPISKTISEINYTQNGLLLLRFDELGNTVEYACFYQHNTGKCFNFKVEKEKEKLDFLATNGIDEYLFLYENKELVLLKINEQGQNEILFRAAVSKVCKKGHIPVKGRFLRGAYYLFFHRCAKKISFKNKYINSYLDKEKTFSIRDFLPLNDSLLFISSYAGKGKYVFNRKNKQAKDFDLPARLNVVEHKYKHAESTVFAIDQSDSLVVFGCHGPSFFEYDKIKQKATIHYPQMGEASHTNSFLLPFFDSNKQLWFGMKKGLCSIVKASEESEHLYVKSIPLLAQYTINGVYQLPKDKHKYWLASSNGAYLFDTQQGLVVDSIPFSIGEKLRAIGALDDHHMWLVADNKPPYIWNTNSNHIDSINLYKEELQNSFHGLMVDKRGNYWLPSNNGLFYYEPQTHWLYVFTQNNSSLPFNEFNSLAWEQLDDGTIVLGGINGMIMFSPEDVIDQLKASFVGQAALRLTSLTTYNNKEHTQKTYPYNALIGEQLVFNFGSSTDQINFKFRLFGAFTDQINYYYRLGNEEEQKWLRLDNGSLNISNLNYGTHHLELAAGLGFGNYFYAKKTILLHKAKPWYLQWWGLLLGLAVSIIFVQYLVRLRTKTIAARNSWLEQELEKRSQEILRDKIIIEKQYEELSLLNHAKDKLFALIGHELRSPMIGLMGLTEKVAYLVKKQKFEHLNKIGKQLDNYVLDTQSLLSNLLNWAQVMLHEKELEKESINVCESIEKICTQFGQIIQEKNITILNQIPPQQTIEYDSESFFIIFRNLIHNAIKFSYTAGEIYIDCQVLEQKIIITVEDQGQGMPDEILNNWEKEHFFSSSKGTAGEKGSGLGLALCRTVSKINKSQLFFQIAAKQGTLATVIIDKEIEI